jgi:hypothetical protein
MSKLGLNLTDNVKNDIDYFLKSARGQFGRACSITINNAQKVSAPFSIDIESKVVLV